MACQPESNHLGSEDHHRLAQNGGFGFDPPDSPPKHTQAIDHSRVRISADQGVWVRQSLGAHFAGPDDMRQVFEIDLMDDSGCRGNDAKIVEGISPPTQEGIALPIALEFDFGVAVERLRRGEKIHLHRMIDHQVNGDLRVDLGGVAAEPGERRAHSRQIDHGWHTGKILHDDAGGQVGDIGPRVGFGLPGGQRPHILLSNLPSVYLSQHRLKEHSDRVGQAINLD
jgi:hypothetical protein